MTFSSRGGVQLAEAGKAAGENPLKPSSDARQCFRFLKRLASTKSASEGAGERHVQPHSPTIAQHKDIESTDVAFAPGAAIRPDPICAYGEISSLQFPF